LAAGPLLVASQTRNPLMVAMAAFLGRLPWLLFGLYAGVVADRVNRRADVIATGFVRTAILTAQLTRAPEADAVNSARSPASFSW